MTKVWFGLENLQVYKSFFSFFFQSNNIYIYIFFLADLWWIQKRDYAPEYFAEWSFRQWSEWSNFVCQDEKGTGRGKRKRRPLRKWVSCSAKFETGLGKTAIDFFPFFFLIQLIVLMDLSFFFLRLAAFVQDRYF